MQVISLKTPSHGKNPHQKPRTDRLNPQSLKPHSTHTRHDRSIRQTGSFNARSRQHHEHIHPLERRSIRLYRLPRQQPLGQMTTSLFTMYLHLRERCDLSRYPVKRRNSQGMRHSQHRCHDDRGRIFRGLFANVHRRTSIGKSPKSCRRRKKIHGDRHQRSATGEFLREYRVRDCKLCRMTRIFRRTRIYGTRRGSTIPRRTVCLSQSTKKQRTENAGRHDLHNRTDDQRRKIRRKNRPRQLDGPYQGRFTLRTMGTYHSRDG